MAQSTAARAVTVENITVHQVGKFGVRVDEKTWFGVNEPLTPSHFMPNEGYKVSVTVSKTGKKYINEILGQEQKQDAPAAEAPTPAPAAKTEVPKMTPAEAVKTVIDRPTRSGFGTPLTAYDLQIQRQINRSSNWNAACDLGSALSQFTVNTTELKALIREFADAGVKYTNE